jgi:tyrosinase
MTRINWDRRAFLGLAAAGSVAAVAGGGGGGPPMPARVRKEVNSLTSTEITEFRTAVKLLRERMPTDPKSWRAQAVIHQDFCPHGNWFFLPWHRAYLWYFEEICREALGPGNAFALPYWDWTANPLLPATFWGLDNPLNDSSREIDPNEPIPPEVAGPAVLANILGITDFETFASGKALTQRPNTPPFGFTGQLEGVPHNNIHGLIGGNMATYMSPLDPIFWLHHANIDRLWTEWDRLHPAAGVIDPEWLDFEVNTFADTAGAAAKRKVSDLLSTYKLGYRYDTQPADPPMVIAMAKKKGPPKVPEGFMAMTRPTARATTVAALSGRVALAAPLREHVTAAARAEARPGTIRLVLQDIPVPVNQRFLVRVFLNCKDPTSRTPVGDPTYVGSFSFFDHLHTPAVAAAGGHEAKKDGHATAPTRSFTFDISEVVRRLERAGQYQADAELKVSLVPVPLRRGQSVLAAIQPAKIEIVGLQ